MLTPADAIRTRVAELVEAAPELNSEQCDRLRQIFTSRSQTTDTSITERRSA